MVHLIEFGKSKLCERTYDLLTTDNSYKYSLRTPLEEINESDFIIWFFENMSYQEITNASSNIRQHFNKNRILFISALSDNTISIGPTYQSSKNSCLDSSLFFIYQKDFGIINKNLSNKIKLCCFDNILKKAFYSDIFFSIISKIKREISSYYEKTHPSNFYNKIELINLVTYKSSIEYSYPILEKKKNLFSNKQNEDLLNDLQFISESRNNFRFNSKESSLNDYEIGIVGGGTSGYLTAIALKIKFPSAKISLIESDKLPIIGVGEATTPDLNDFLFNELKINKLDFYKKVEPTWKLGIKFFWGKPGNYYFNYPFGNHDIITGYLNGNINEGSLTSILMNEDSSFILRNGEKDYYSLSNPQKIGYALHLDNKKFVTYLKQKAINLGINRLEAIVEKVNANKTENKIINLITDEGKILNYDFYIDCSGFKSLLINKLDSEYYSFNKNLLTDKAITFNVPHNGKIKPYTYAESMKNGWCWNIPTRDSDHRGYVFSSQFCSEEQALSELKEKYPLIDKHRLIKFKSGRHNSFVKNNVAAIGNSYGFVEPLESTGIHMIVAHIKALSDNIEDLLFNNTDNTLEKMLNEEIRERWDYLEWFLSIHYKFNNKFNTPFWKYCRENINISKYQYILDLYKKNGPLQKLNNNMKRNILKYNVDSLFGLYGIDNILIGQGIIPEKMNERFEKKGNLLWHFNVNTWRRISKQTIPLKDDIKVLTQNPDLI